MPSAICSLHGPVPSDELSWNKECGQVHVTPQIAGHTLTGEPCFEIIIPAPDRNFQARDIAIPEGLRGETNRGIRGPMAPDVDR